MPSTYAHRRFGADVLALLPDGIREGTVLICENFEYRIKTL